jgi:hypothetical protein
MNHHEETAAAAGCEPGTRRTAPAALRQGNQQETVSTIGEQRQVNYALQPMTKGAFVELVTADQPDAPPYFTMTPS